MKGRGQGDRLDAATLAVDARHGDALLLPGRLRPHRPRQRNRLTEPRSGYVGDRANRKRSVTVDRRRPRISPGRAVEPSDRHQFSAIGHVRNHERVLRLAGHAVSRRRCFEIHQPRRRSSHTARSECTDDTKHHAEENPPAVSKVHVGLRPICASGNPTVKTRFCKRRIEALSRATIELCLDGLRCLHRRRWQVWRSL